MLNEYIELINQYLTDKYAGHFPENLYDPVSYILKLPGKRIRPVLVMLTAEGYQVDRQEALPAAAALEIFHNFTLLHDDIMDDAYVRRGQPTVHRKWDINTAILSGDAMVYLAQQELEVYPDKTYKRLQQLFNSTALEICEGQQMDMDFEKYEEVSSEEYMEMIRKKTAVLLGTSMAFGAIVAGQDEKEVSYLQKTGDYIGIAFQMLDDYLDLFGNSDFGKKTGGDILEKKKTFLYVKALEKLRRPQRDKLIELYHSFNIPDEEKVYMIKKLYEDSGIDKNVLQEAHHFTDKAISTVDKTKMNKKQKGILIKLAMDLKNRTK